MKVILHDLGPEYEPLIESKCDRAVAADGKYLHGLEANLATSLQTPQEA